MIEPEPDKNSMPVIDLLPRELCRALPPLNSQEGISDPIVYAKFVSRESSWVWYVTEGSPQGDDFLFFGLVIGLEAEWGNFSLSELAKSPPWEFPIERDLHFTADRLSRVMAREQC
jgi:Protein of unknown function (DUF2958)